MEAEKLPNVFCNKLYFISIASSSNIDLKNGWISASQRFTPLYKVFYLLHCIVIYAYFALTFQKSKFFM